MDSYRQRNPEIALAFELYRECRSQQLFTVEKSDGNKAINKIAVFTTGYAQLPNEGGILDQPYRLMALFSLFMDGDRMATFLNLQRS